MNKEIVFLGDYSSVYNKSLLNQLEKKGLNVSCINICDEINALRKYNFKIRFLKKIQTFLLIGKVFRRFDKTNKNSRIVHIQFVAFENIFYLKYLKKYFSKIIITFWGSDLLRQSNKRLFFMKKLFKACDKITFETSEMEEIFLKKCPFYKDTSKFSYTRFGLIELDEIDSVQQHEVTEFAKKYGINPSKKIVVIGYNRRVEQQHIAVLENIPNSLVDRIQIIIPWSYGEVSKDYEEDLICALKKSNVSYIFIKDFISDKELACLRLCTDVLIQVQTTDSLSASMLETLYAKKSVITGEWLPYNFLDEKGIKMYKVSTPQAAGELLSVVLDSLSQDEEKNRQNSKLVGSFSKWDSCIDGWLSLYN